MFSVNPFVISEILAAVSKTSVLTIADHSKLMGYTFDYSLAEEHRKSVNQILDLVHRGRIKLVNKRCFEQI